ncbi:hypothetical protein M0802_003298 [Mischocyttarus mexicanus]|nr:hypothetical protein M0802_003298 [Mischocyttarus mexicanus]
MVKEVKWTHLLDGKTERSPNRAWQRSSLMETLSFGKNKAQKYKQEKHSFSERSKGMEDQGETSETDVKGTLN